MNPLWNFKPVQQELEYRLKGLAEAIKERHQDIANYRQSLAICEDDLIQFHKHQLETEHALRLLKGEEDKAPITSWEIRDYAGDVFIQPPSLYFQGSPRAG